METAGTGRLSADEVNRPQYLSSPTLISDVHTTTYTQKHPAMTAAVSVPLIATRATTVSKQADTDNLGIGYLRAFITLLVVAHHAVMALHHLRSPSAHGAQWTDPLVGGVSDC